MARPTVASLQQDIARLTALVESMAAPATAAPAKGKASAAFGGVDFDTYVANRRAAALPCGVDSHTPETCNRTFSPKSSGRTQHEPRIV